MLLVLRYITTKVPKPSRLDSSSTFHKQQGALDGLCGFYSVVNAFTFIFYDGAGRRTYQLRGKREFRETLFNKLLKKFFPDDTTKASDVIDTITEGTTKTNLMAIIAAAKNIVKDLFTNPAPTFKDHKTNEIKGTSDELLKHLNSACNSHCCFIIRITNSMDHWTVADGATDARLNLIDSGGMKHFNREFISCKPVNNTSIHVITEVYKIALLL